LNARPYGWIKLILNKIQSMKFAIQGTVLECSFKTIVEEL
jgi:hypothetical protein